MLKLNLRILRTFNSCDRREFFALLDEVYKIPGIFTRKRYLWNWFRPRDFYKMIADYVIEKMKTKEPENFQIAEHDQGDHDNYKEQQDQAELRVEYHQALSDLDH